jgi:pSer/pThr/pTyr-binding forkhead associated (FHA) protein
MLIELGSYLFTVKETLNHSKCINLECLNVVTSMMEELCIDLTQKPNYLFGRKNNNDFARDDQHMSGTHAKIFFFNGKFFLEDIDSTNGYIFY